MSHDHLRHGGRLHGTAQVGFKQSNVSTHVLNDINIHTDRHADIYGLPSVLFIIN